MKVLVAYASRHGATQEIAERIAAVMTDAGLDAEARPVTEVELVDRYDAFVIGSAVYMFRWLRPAKHFLKANRAVLAERPVWLFSSGPLGTERFDDKGRDVLEVAAPRNLDRLRRQIQPRGEQVFYGARDPSAPAVGVIEALMKKSAPKEDGMPVGDFRDWTAIEAWAEEIAAALTADAPKRPVQASA